MSYCRWSSDNFRCDIYAYEDTYGGYTIHVASSRHKGEVPKVDYNLIWDEKNHPEFMRQSEAQNKYLETCGTEPINLPLAGETFNCADLEEFYNKMVELQNLGYHIPKNVINNIKEEKMNLPKPVSIRIQTLDDLETKPNVMPEAIGKSEAAVTTTVCIMEDMTEQHKAGVSIVLENPDGSYTVSNITEGMFDMVIASYKGALERFKDLKKIRE